MLGSINLSEFVVRPFENNAIFDYEVFSQAVIESVIALNEVLHEGLPLLPLQEQKDSVNNWRQIGLGVMGWHNCLIKLGVRYGSKESIEIAEEIASCMLNTAIETSANLTDAYGQFPMYDKEALLHSSFFLKNVDYDTAEIVREKGLANSQLLTIAPTGSIGTMLGVSTGMEPIYDIEYTRKTESLHNEDTYYKIYTPIVEDYMIEKHINDVNDLPDFFNTAMTIDYRERIEMQATWQKYIDASISSTVNLPESATIEDIEDIYMLAWEKGLKGVTVYRDGCDRKGVLSKDEVKEEKQKENGLTWGTTLVATDDLIGRKKKIMTGCGSLHVQGWFDPVTGNLMELYLSKGSRGGCLSWMAGNSRIISAALRSGTNFNYIIDQLKSAPVCVSYAVRTATKKDTSPGNSCPSAVANALIEMQKDVFDELFDDEDVDEVKVMTETKNKCPECGAKLQYQNGCFSCVCGYSACD